MGISIPKGISDTASGLVSKRLGLAGTGIGIIGYLTTVGLSPDKAGLYVTILGGLFIIGESFVAYKREGMKGLLANLRKTAEEVKAGGVVKA